MNETVFDWSVVASYHGNCFKKSGQVFFPLYSLVAKQRTVPMTIKSCDILPHNLQIIPVKSYIADNGILETNKL